MFGSQLRKEKIIIKLNRSEIPAELLDTIRPLCTKVEDKENHKLEEISDSLQHSSQSVTEEKSLNIGDTIYLQSISEETFVKNPLNRGKN